MTGEEWRRIAAAFDAICDRTPEERGRRIAELARSEPAIASQVAAMLAADGRDGGALGGGPLELEPTLFGDDPEAPGAEELVAGARLGAWRLVERLRGGGMGEVWAAERADGTFELRVAIKILRRGLESPSLLARFDLERKILGRLAHPAIARLLDAGSTPDGRPFVVLEWIDGEPIDVWCASRRLAVEARLRLVLQACTAVDWAHRNLVVHRDLKPTNVLVSREGEVKLLDFGIAKLLDPDGDEPVRVTSFEDRALTPAYAAPEQIRGEPVTTATDVYALGVLLYELLTGRLPHRRPRRPLPELAARLADERPERPSSAARSATPPDESTARRLAGDLDTIVLTALAHEPERRYGSAAALAADLERHLAGFPIAARRESVRHRLGLFVRRNRLAVGAAAMLLATAGTGLFGIFWQARRADQNAHRTARVRDLLLDVFRQADPRFARGREISARELLDRGSERIRSELAGDPALEADFDLTLAEIYRSLGLFARAESLAERALGLREGTLPRDRVATATARALLGDVRLAQGRPVEARSLLEAAHATLAAELGADALQVVAVESALAQTLGEEEPARAETLRRHVLEVRSRRLGPAHPESSLARFELAELLDIDDRFREAEPLYRQAVRELESGLGANDPRVARAQVALAGLLDRTSRPLEAEPLYRSALAAQRATLGPDHPEVGDTLYSYSDLLQRSSRYVEAEQALRAALAIFAEPGLDRAYCLRELAVCLTELGRVVEATALFEAAIPLFRTFAGENHPELWRTEAFLGVAHLRAGDHRRAEVELRRAIAELERKAGPTSLQIRGPLRFLAEAVARDGRFAEAVVLLQRVRAIETALFGGGPHRDLAQTDRELGIALAALGTEAARLEARAALDRAIAADRALRDGSPELAASLLASARLRRESGDDPQLRRAELAEADAILAARLPSDDRLQVELATERKRTLRLGVDSLDSAKARSSKP